MSFFSTLDRRILAIALPSIVSNITVPLLGLVDVAVTGHMGSDGVGTDSALPASYYVGAIAVGGMLFNIIYWMFGFLRMGTGGETAQAWGRRDLDGVVLLLVRNLLLALVLALVLMIASPLIRDVALWYIGMQNSRFPMLVAIGQNLLNIACSIFFVYALDMRIEGVALGTLLAQWVAFAIALLLCLRYYQRLWHRKTFSMPPLSLLLRQVVAPGTISNRQNLSLFLRTLCLIVVHFMFISAGAAQGSMALAVNTLLMQLFTMFSYFMDGFAYAGEALVGKAVGACNRNACHTIVRRLFMWGGVVSLLFVVLYAIGGNAFMSLLTDDTSVLDTLSHYRLWTLLLPICGVASFLWDGIYIGATAPRLMLLSMVISMCVFLVGYYFLIPLWGNHALWLSFLSYLACRGMVQTCTRAKILP